MEARNIAAGGGVGGWGAIEGAGGGSGAEVPWLWIWGLLLIVDSVASCLLTRV